MSDLDWFFRSPRAAPRENETFSQLYLLRRDIDTCFGIDPNTGLAMKPVDETTHQPLYCKAIWPATMAVLGGIDLLAKFLAGSDKSRGRGKDSVGGRFETFAHRYFGLAEGDAHAVYQLRNSLLHSFGLYSEEIDHKGNIKASYNFLLTQCAGVLVKRLDRDKFVIDVQLLRSLFDQAIARYEADLRDNSRKDHKELSENFAAMFPKHAKPMSVFKLKRT